MGQGPFCACPVSLVSGLFFAVVPGCAKWFLFVAPRWAPRPFGGARAKTKKKTPPRVFFFALAPCHSGTTANQFLETNDTGHEHKLGATTKTLVRPWTAMLTHFFSGATFPAGPGWCFFFCCGPARTHSLTEGLGGDASRRGGASFLLRPPRGPGWCFFFLAVPPPGRSLTHCGLGRFRQGPGGVFFCCGPAEPGEPIIKNVWCTTSGLKKTRRGHSKKKNTTSLTNVSTSYL